jgi:hypothetical protein
MVQFRWSHARLFDTDLQPKKFEVPDVRFKVKEPLDWHTFGHCVNQSIVEINRMLKSCGPVFCGKSSTIEEHAHVNSELIVINFDCAILGWTVCAGRFDSVVMVTEYHITELDQPGKFPILICPN